MILSQNFCDVPSLSSVEVLTLKTSTLFFQKTQSVPVPNLSFRNLSFKHDHPFSFNWIVSSTLSRTTNLDLREKAGEIFFQKGQEIYVKF